MSVKHTPTGVVHRGDKGGKTWVWNRYEEKCPSLG